jgi:chemotaxis protein histidine kinase CheA
MLGQFRSGSIPIQKETLNFLFDSVDAAKLMVDGVAANQPEDPLVVNSIKQSYKDITDKIRAVPAAGAPAARPEAPRPQPTPSQQPAQPAAPKQQPAEAGPARTKDDLDLAWERTFDINSDEAIVVEPLIDEAPPAVRKPAVVPPPAQPVTRQAAKPEAAPEIKPPSVPAPAAAAPAPPVDLKRDIEESKRSGIHEKRGLGRRASDAADIEKQFIRVNIERLDNLMNLVGEMVVNRNRLARQVEFIKTLREELAFSQTRLLHEIKKFEEKYEYTLTYGMTGPEHAGQSNDFMELEFDRYDDFNLLSRKLTEITNDTNEIRL